MMEGNVKKHILSFLKFTGIALISEPANKSTYTDT